MTSAFWNITQRRVVILTDVSGQTISPTVVDLIDQLNAQLFMCYYVYRIYIAFSWFKKLTTILHNNARNEQS
jgi:hypothetical protein